MADKPTNKKIFSIVIPAYNAQDTIVRTLCSLFSCLDYILEIIIGNDRSTDRTLEIIKPLQKILPIRVIDVDEDLPHGPSAARNAGLDAALGDWIVFIDADDMLDINGLAPLYREMIKYEHLADIPFFATPFQEWNTENDTKAANPITSLSWVHGKAYNRNFLKKHNIRFRPELYTHEDTDFNNQAHTWMIRDFKTMNYFVINNVVFYRWIRKPDSMTNKIYDYDDGKSTYIMFALRDLMFAFWNNYKQVYMCEDMPDDIKNNVKEGAISQVLMYYFYYQPHKESCSSEKQIDKNLVAMRDYYFDVKETFGVTKDDIIDFFKKNRQKYENTRQGATRGVGIIIEETSFPDFLDMLETYEQKFTD